MDCIYRDIPTYHLPSENVRFLAAFVMVFISSLLGLALVTIAVSGVVHLLGLGTFDRLLGVFFGIVRVPWP